MVTAVGHISGGHFNPAVTLGFLVTRRIHPINAVVYWIVQFGGAALAVLLIKWVLPSATSPYGAPALTQVLDKGQGVAVEATLTFFLVWVIFACAADPRGAFDKVAGLAIGATITMGMLMALPAHGRRDEPGARLRPAARRERLGRRLVDLVRRPVRRRRDRRGALRAALPALARAGRAWSRRPRPAGRWSPTSRRRRARAETVVVEIDETVEAPRWPAEDEPPRTDADR